MAIHWSLATWLWPLLLVLAAGAVLWTVALYRTTRPDPGPRLRRTLTVLRSAVLLLLALAMAGPVLSRLREVVEPPELVVVLEDSGSMALPALDDTSRTRWDLALDLADSLERRYGSGQATVRLLRGNGRSGVQGFALDDAAIPPPSRHGTALSGLVDAARRDGLGRPVRALVVIGDGGETEAGDPGASGGPAGSAAVPVHVIGVGDLRGPADRALADIRLPSTAFRGDEVVVDFAVVHRAADPGALPPVVVSVTGDSGIVAADTLAASEPLVTGSLAFRPEETGLQTYRLAVSPLVDERFLSNNEATLAVDVRRERARILLLAGTPDWNVRFIAQAVAREARLELAVVHPGPDGFIRADSLLAWSAPVTAAEWARWDAVAVTGWTGPLADLAWNALADAVDQGLGLVVLPGGQRGAGGPVAFPPPADLERVLPVSIERWRWDRGNFSGALAPTGRGHAILDGIGDGGITGLRALPPLRELVRVSPAENGDVLVQAGEAEPAAPVLVAGRQGEGRTAWFGARHLWEWAFWPADQDGVAGGAHPGRRLIRNLLVWAALDDDDAGLEITNRTLLFEEGESVELTARWRDVRGRPVNDRRLEAVLGSGDEGDSTAVRTFAAAPSVDGTGERRIPLPPLPPGRYTVELRGEGDPPVTGARRDLVVTGGSVERRQVRQDRARLAQLAARNDGAYGASDGAVPGAVRAALDRTDWTGATSRSRSRLDPWAGWPFLGLVTILLCCEWLLRRRHGLL